LVEHVIEAVVALELPAKLLYTPPLGG